MKTKAKPKMTPKQELAWLKQKVRKAIGIQASWSSKRIVHQLECHERDRRDEIARLKRRLGEAVTARASLDKTYDSLVKRLNLALGTSPLRYREELGADQCLVDIANIVGAGRACKAEIEFAREAILIALGAKERETDGARIRQP